MTKEQKEQLFDLERQFIFAKSKHESDVALAKIIQLLPNDVDLGQYLRNLHQNKVLKYD
jgi:hypothetical protein